MILLDIDDMEIKNYRHQLSDLTYDFNKDYVKSKIFPRALGRKIADEEELINLIEKYCI